MPIGRLKKTKIKTSHSACYQNDDEEGIYACCQAKDKLLRHNGCCQTEDEQGTMAVARPLMNKAQWMLPD